MNMKEAFVTKEQIEEIVKKYPTPFHIYDEKGIRENAKALKEAFAWNKGFKEFFAVKATPNPFLINILREYGCGCDCSSMTELMLSNAMGVSPQVGTRDRVLILVPTIPVSTLLSWMGVPGGLCTLCLMVFG